jgi:hypothetical protein
VSEVPLLTTWVPCLEILKSWQLSERDAVLVKYTDDDGDMVTILDNGDLSHAKT